MTKFLINYCAPQSDLQAWMQLPEEVRKSQEQDLMQKWNTWSSANKALIVSQSGAGKATRITNSGTTEQSNDLMVTSVMEAESKEALIDVLKTCPHFDIPTAYIEVMALREIPIA